MLKPFLKFHLPARCYVVEYGENTGTRDSHVRAPFDRALCLAEPAPLHSGTTCTAASILLKASANPCQEPESGEAFSCSRATDQIVLVVNGPRFLRILLERGAGRCRQAIHRPTACVRCRANGGAREFLPRGLGASRKRQKMRKRCATTATDPSSKKENPRCSSFRKASLSAFPNRRLRRVHVRPIVLAPHYRHRRPVPGSRHIRLGQGYLGDRSDRIPLSCDIRVYDHAVEGHGGAKQPADATGA